MGSGEPLGSPMSEFPGTPDIEAILDGPYKLFEHVPVVNRKRKKGGPMEEEITPS